MSRTDAKIGFLLGAIDPATGTGAVQRGNAVDADVERQGIDAVLNGHFNAFGRRHELVAGASTAEHRYQNDIVSLYGAPYTPVDVFSHDPHAVPEPVTPASALGPNQQRTRQSGVFGTLRLKLAEPLTLVAGARSSHWTFRQHRLRTGIDISAYSDSAITPFAGLVYDLGQSWSVYASYADVFEVQNRFAFGGGQLPPTTGANYEAGVKGELADGRLQTSLALFQIRRQNIAQRDAVHTGPTDCNGSYCYVTGGETESQGLEAEVSGALGAGWNVFAGYTFNTTRYVVDRLPNGQPSANQGQPLASHIPRHILRLWTQRQLQGELNRWSLGAGVNVQSEYYRILSGQRMAQPGYAVWNARVAYQASPRWTASVQMNNLTDKVYYAGLNLLDQGGFYGEPRSVVLALRGSF
ncbi:MAG: TonB-dependent receptor [Haliea sp.]|nr:MAG: TonB-dependent receptor [Haliea sp.]